jgi:hypothetical protein
MKKVFSLVLKNVRYYLPRILFILLSRGRKGRGYYKHFKDEQ